MPVITMFWCSSIHLHVASSRIVFFARAAGARVVDVLDARLAEPQLGLPEVALDLLALAVRPLGVDEQAEALVEGQAPEIRVFLLGDPSVGQAAAGASRSVVS